jgi:hypothetical protein
MVPFIASLGKSQVWCYKSVIPATWEAEVGGSPFKASYKHKDETLCEKQIKAKWAGGMAQMVERLA